MITKIIDLSDEVVLEHLKDVVRIQGADGNWNYDNYMQGMYNGMELMLSIVEGREPNYKTCKNEKDFKANTITLPRCTNLNCEYNHAEVCFLKKELRHTILCDKARNINAVESDEVAITYGNGLEYIIKMDQKSNKIIKIEGANK